MKHWWVCRSRSLLPFKIQRGDEAARGRAAYGREQPDDKSSKLISLRRVCSRLKRKKLAGHTKAIAE
jgi:hypothetical protein